MKLSPAFRLAVLSVFLALPIGCKTVSAPLPANAINSLDAQSNTILQTAYAFAHAWTLAVQSTDPNVHISLSATQISLLNKLNLALNIAVPLEQAYHASPTAANQSALQAKVPAVQSSFTAASGSITAALPVVPAATAAAKLPTTLASGR